MQRSTQQTRLSSARSDDVSRLMDGRLHDPRLVLGRHDIGDGQVALRACLPEASEARIAGSSAPMRRIPGTSVFEWKGPGSKLDAHPIVQWADEDGVPHESPDPYSFALQLDDTELRRFGDGRHHHAQRMLGAHIREIDGIAGVLFAVWAPNAERVSVVGDFNGWDGRCHPMTVRGSSGVWEIFIPGMATGELYKFEIRNRDTGSLHIKTDPYGRAFERRPATSSVVIEPSGFDWQDEEWMQARALRNWQEEPVSIYELHLGSWRRGPNGEFLNYREIADSLISHMKELGFTHVEVMPLTEHPLDDSWGYQTTGFFAPTSRFGHPDDLRWFVSEMHTHGIGVILDWVPGHFPKDAHGLARFDGAPLYEYADHRKGEHPDWKTLVFDYSRHEVRSFLLSSAIYWLEAFHFDGLRVDAVASMLYLDYSRKHGEWSPNIYGGNENLEAIDFLKELNIITHRDCPGTMTIAEESTAWPKVSKPTYDGGLGFTFKWNMGWMHDSLLYMRNDPVHRRYHHDLLTFGPLYAFTENFVLPLSHDEVVHGKGSLLGKMPGDDWQRFANLRLAYTFQWTYPGKKLLFMGAELAQPGEWNHHEALPWHLQEYDAHAGIGALLRDLNDLYVRSGAMHLDGEAAAFYWLSWDDREHSVLSFARSANEDSVYIILNFTPVPREGYRIGVPEPGSYIEIFNSDSRFYGGTDIGNPLPLQSEDLPCMGQPHSIVLSLPPLAGVVLRATR